jgi:gas vesicle protein
MSANNFFSFLAGAAAGAAVAWLLTSEKGQETVAELKDKAAAGMDQLGNAFEEFKDKAKASAKAAVETVEEAVKQQQ